MESKCATLVTKSQQITLENTNEDVLWAGEPLYLVIYLLVNEMKIFDGMIFQRSCGALNKTRAKPL